MSEPNVNVIVGGPNNSSTKNKIRILKATLPFASQVNEEDVIYVIRYDFDLNGDTVTIPENCVLQFEGGSLSNGIISGKIKIDNNSNSKILDNVSINTDTFECFAEWFGLSSTNSVNNVYLNECFESISNNTTIYIEPNTYFFDDTPIICNKIVTLLSKSYYSRGKAQFIFSITASHDDNFALITFNTVNTIVRGITFNIVREYPAINSEKAIGLLFNDTINPGQVDSQIIECAFNRIGCAICANGRGILVRDNLFAVCTTCLKYKPASVQTSSDVNQNPPYDGRALVFENNRIHWLNLRYLTDSYFVVCVNNPDVPKATLLGALITNNQSDGIAGIIKSDIPCKDTIISDNISLYSIDNSIKLNSGFKDITVTNNIIIQSLHETRNITNLITLSTKNSNNDYDTDFVSGNVLITNNVLQSSVGDSTIYIRKDAADRDTNAANLYNFIIANNIVEGATARSFLLFKYTTVYNCAFIGNRYVLDSTIAGNQVYRYINCWIYNSTIETDNIADSSSILEALYQRGNKFIIKNISSFGTTAHRPINAVQGFQYYDKNLNKPVYYNGVGWADTEGFTATIKRGTTAQRPTSVLTEEDVGYEYFDITLGKPIYLKVENTGTTEEPVYTKSWVDALGNPVDSVYPKVIGTLPTTGNVAVFDGTDIKDGGTLPTSEETTP